MIRIFEYEKFKTGSIYLGSSVSERSYSWHGRYLNKRVAAYDDDLHSDRGARETIDDQARHYFIKANPQANPTLYIAKEVRTPRDLYRNSGFSIVRDKSKASAIIVPNFTREDVRHNYQYLIADNENNLHALTLSDGRKDLNDFEKERIRYHYDSLGWTILVESPERTKTVQLIPDIEEYRDLAVRKNLYGDAYYETDVELSAQKDIDVETLLIWEKYEDVELLCKSIVASNWAEYPLTVKVFLMENFPESYKYGGSGYRVVVDTLDLVKSSYYSEVLANNNSFVSPKDWNLLQNYIMTKLNIDGPAFISERRLQHNKLLLSCIRTKTAVAPLFINQPIKASDLAALFQAQSW